MVPPTLTLLEHTRQLRGLFEEACRLVYHFFGQLQLDTLETVEDDWKRFTEDRALIRIPLPRSNSEPARQMRVAAVLRLIAEMACDYIFQPVYLTNDGMEVAEIIDQLGSLEAQWVRSVLLNIDTKEQVVNGMKRAKIAAGKVIEIVGFLITSPADKQDLKSAVSEWYHKASKLWMSVQQLETKIEAQLEVQVVGQGVLGWKAFQMPSLKDKQPAAGTQNGARRKPDDKDQLVMEDIVAEIWPQFLATVDDEHSMLLVSGQVLLNSQIVTASQELKAASLDRGGGSHRTAHGRQRLVRPVTGGANGSTENLSFLSQKA